MCKHRHTFPAIPSFNWVLLLAGSDTWSWACWEGIFQHVTILSIMSGPRPSSALAASPAPCQRLYVLHADLQRFWHWTDGPELKLCMPPHCLRGWGGAEGGGVARPKKHLSCRRHSDKSVAARKYDFTPGGMREPRHVARLLHTV